MDNNSGGEDKADKKPGTRVFKKSSPNGKITVYLGKRDFVDHISHVDPIGKLSTCFVDLNELHKLFVSKTNFSFALCDADATSNGHGLSPMIYISYRWCCACRSRLCQRTKSFWTCVSCV